MEKFCVNCGKKIENGDTFCTNCGTKVDGSSNSSVSSKKTNPFALSGFIVSLVSSILCCGLFNTVSLVLSILGVAKAKEYDNNGKELAIAGIVISAIPMVLGILATLFSIITGSYVSTPYFEI